MPAIQQIRLCACHGQRECKKIGGPAGAARRQNDWENRASRNSPSLAVALNCGMGSSSLNAEVNAFERLQIVRGRNSSYFGSKYRSCTVRARCWGFEIALDKRLVDDHLRSDVRQFTPLPGFDLLSHGLEVSLHPVDAH